MADSRQAAPARLAAASWLRRWQIVLLHLPQWRMWCLSLLAWGWLIFVARFNASGDFCTTAYGSAGGLRTTVLRELPSWLIMVAAMMLPLQNEAVRHVAFSNPRYRQHRACTAFILGYGAFWLANGVLLLAVRYGIEAVAANPARTCATLASCAFALAALRVWSDARQRSMLACSRTLPLRISGWRADRDCLRFGTLTGWHCARNCQLPMLGLVLAGHGAGQMLLLSLILLAERSYLPHESRLPGYAWGLMTLFYLGRSIYNP